MNMNTEYESPMSVLITESHHIDMFKANYPNYKTFHDIFFI